MTAPIKHTDTLLDPNLSLRPVTWNDLHAVTKLIYEVCLADGDEVFAPTAEELEHEWKKQGFTLEKDAWVVTTVDGRVVGYEEFVNRHAHASLQGDGYVAVDMLGKGIGTALLRALEIRAREEVELAEPDLRVFIHNYMSMSDGDKIGREMHEHEGYKAIRYSWQMRIDLDGPPPMPEFPEGIELRPFNEAEHAHLVWAADEEAFSDHWGHTPTSYEKWRENFIATSNYEPNIWYIAWDGDEVAGHALCRYRAEIGWVRHLAVRRPWRKKGLGLALLYHCFNEFFKSGMPSIGLGVDASNPTGATRLYKKAGMKVTGEYVIYEKELCPGRDLEEEE